jgi:hypothetical protein
MNGDKIKQIALSLVTVMVLTACGGGGGTDTPKSIAMDSIKAYAENGSSDAPTIQTYADAGVQGVTVDNIKELNVLVDGLTAEDVDTVEEINALTATLGINILPVANAQTVTLDEDSSKDITLTATDAEGSSLTYALVTQPTHGTLSGTAPNLTYTPTADYFGADGFTFKVNDGEADSAVVKVTISVGSIKDAPVVDAGADNSVQVNSSINLVGTVNDIEGNIFDYEWKRGSTVLATTRSFSYTPTAVTTEVLTFTVIDIDGVRTSDTMSLVVTAKPNVAPVANAQTVTLDEDATKAITLVGTDSDGDSLTYTLVTQPTHGTLSGTVPNLTYTPTANYFGTDELTFKANDGKVDSATVKVSINIASVNDAPTAEAGEDKTVEVNKPIRIAGSGTDIDGTVVGYVWESDKEGSTGVQRAVWD